MSQSSLTDFVETVHGVPLRDFKKEPLQVLSMGGGVQSTAMLGLIRQGLLPKPDICIHADTGSELPETEVHIEEVVKPVCEELGIPFVIARSHRGTLHDDYLRLRAIPMIGTRSCTKNFKIDPQRRVVREIVGRGRGNPLAVFWLGITTDEERRSLVKKKDHPRYGERNIDTDVQWAHTAYPLLDVYPQSRKDCERVNEMMGWTIGKSGCFCCPYMGVKSHRRVRTVYPDLFKISMKMEATADERLKEEGRSLKWGLCKEMRLDVMDDLPESYFEDSTCDSDGGCFI